MDIGFRIQTGGERKRWVDVMKQLVPRVVVIERKPLWEACKACLLSANHEETHLCIMQDDILPCNDFVEAVNEIVRHNPDEIITLFTANDNAQQTQYNYLSLDVWFMAQCYIVPVGIAYDMVEWIEKHVKESVLLDDDRMATYCWFNNKRVLATNPSLVEHIGWRSTTLRTYKNNEFDKKISHRIAQNYIGFEKSGLSIDWNKRYMLQVSEGSDKMFISNLNHYASKTIGKRHL